MVGEVAVDVALCDMSYGELLQELCLARQSTTAPVARLLAIRRVADLEQELDRRVEARRRLAPHSGMAGQGGKLPAAVRGNGSDRSQQPPRFP